MWIFNKHGYYSVCSDIHCKEGELMIRARQKSDLERMLNSKEFTAGASSKPKNILTIAHSDYRHRVKVLKLEWMLYMSAMINDLDYPSVKDHISNCTGETPVQRKARHKCYMNIWHELYFFQNINKLDIK